MELINSFNDNRLIWLNNPSSWNIDDNTGEKEGSCGNSNIEQDGKLLIIYPPTKKDFWLKTFYTPLLIKTDASALLCDIPLEIESTCKIDLSLNAITQFDQGGLLVYIDESHWMKCGIEYCDGMPRLSVVVTNTFSDWSTQMWSSLSVRLKIHKVRQSDSIVVEAAEIGSEDYHFIRIAHLSHSHTSDSPIRWRIGPYSASPIKNNGCFASFSNFFVGDKEESAHSSNL